MTVASQTTRKRSRNGCLSCKKLKIKCDEAKPKCEYCSHTNRDCVYPDTLGGLSKKKDDDEDMEFDINRRKYDNMIRLRSLVNKVRNNYEDPSDSYFTFDQLVTDLVFLPPTSQLNVSKFELRLIHFFDQFCIPLFSFGVNQDVHNVWKNQVPSLFLSSQLVRSSVFSFAALNLLPLCDLNLMQKLDNGSEFDEYRGRVGRTFNLVDNTVNYLETSHNLSRKTSEYFMDTIQITNFLVGADLTSGKPVSGQRAAELTTSSILIFSFLCLHPYKIVPLVSWDKSEADLLSISKGIRSTLHTCNPTLYETNFRGLVALREEHVQVGSLEHSKYPIVATIRDQLTDLLEEYEVLDFKILKKHETLRTVIYGFHECVAKCVHCNYPVPMFRWLIMASEEFRELIYEKDFFALRMLFVFCCYCIITKFEIDGGSNVWLDYFFWFKDHNYELFGEGNWKYDFDRAFFNVVKSGVCIFPRGNFRNMGNVDPVAMYYSDSAIARGEVLVNTCNYMDS